jgi:hypothetical protein
MTFELSLSCHLTPLLAIAGYLANPKQLRINPSVLYFGSVMHNGLLVAFSAWTCVSLSQVIYHHGIVFQSNYYFQNAHFDRVIYSRFSLNGIFKQRREGVRIVIGRRYDIQNQYHLERIYCIGLPFEILRVFRYVPAILERQIADIPTKIPSCRCGHLPCGKQHFREIATPDWVSQFTNLAHS